VAPLTVPSKCERPRPVSVKMVSNIQETKEINVKEYQDVEYVRNIVGWEKHTTIPKLRLTLFRIVYNTGTGTTSTTTITATTHVDSDEKDEGRPTGFWLCILTYSMVQSPS